MKCWLISSHTKLPVSDKKNYLMNIFLQTTGILSDFHNQHFPQIGNIFCRNNDEIQLQPREKVHSVNMINLIWCWGRWGESPRIASLSSLSHKHRKSMKQSKTSANCKFQVTEGWLYSLRTSQIWIFCVLDFSKPPIKNFGIKFCVWKRLQQETEFSA